MDSFTEKAWQRPTLIIQPIAKLCNEPDHMRQARLHVGNARGNDVHARRASASELPQAALQRCFNHSLHLRQGD